jgi:hypothetical protein
MTPEEAKKLAKRGKVRAKKRAAETAKAESEAKAIVAKHRHDRALERWSEVEKKIAAAAKNGKEEHTESFWEDRDEATAFLRVVREKGWTTEYCESEKMAGDGGPMYIAYVTISWKA